MSKALRFVFAPWASPFGAAVLAAAAYLWVACRHGFPGVWVTDCAYFNYLADAFLHGQVHLRLTPPSVHDLTEVGGRYYLYWPPLPAVLMMPLVAVWGVGVSDVLFTAAVGVANVALVATLVRAAVARGLFRLSAGDRGMLVACFALGSVHLRLAPLGQVWFTSQVTGVSFVLVGYLAAFADPGRVRTWGLFGLAMAGALACRYHLILCGLWPFSVLALRLAPGRRWRCLAAAALPLAVAAGSLSVYNQARFGSPWDTGVSSQSVAPALAERKARSGQFNVAYLPENLYNTLILYPFPDRFREGLGGSVFLLTPLFFAALLPLWRPTRSAGLLWATVVVTALPGLLLLGGGWFQFGPRYSLDYMAPLLLLTGAGMRRVPRGLSAACVVISCAHYYLGVTQF